MENQQNLKEFLLKKKEENLQIDNPRKKSSNKSIKEIKQTKPSNLSNIKILKEEELEKQLLTLKNEKPTNKKIKTLLSFKVLIHFILALLTIIQINSILNPITEKFRAQERILSDIFLEKSSKESNYFEKIIYLKDIKTIKTHFLNSLKSYFNINSLLINKVKIPSYNTHVEFFFSDENIFNALVINDFEPIKKMQNKSIDLSDVELKMLKFSNYNITKENLGPFALSDNQLKEFLKDVKFFRVNFPLKIYHFDEIKDKEICSEWVN